MTKLGKTIFHNLPIRIKFLVTSFLILFLISAFIFIYYPAEHKKTSLNLLKNKVSSMGEFVALGVGIGMDSNNSQAIHETLNWAKRDRNLAYIKILDTSNQEFANYNPRGNTTNQGASVPLNEIFESDGTLHIRIPLEYNKKNFGTLLLGYSLESLNNSLANNRKTTVLVCLAILILGAISSLILAGMVTRSLQQLKIAANKMAEGDYDTKIAVESSDEVGELGQAMKVMAWKVSNSINEIKVVNKALKAARDVAQEANNTKSHFLSTVSHEFRTPLNAIIGFSEMSLELEEEEEDKEQILADQISNFKYILRAGNHLLVLINEILDLAAIESGKTILSMEPVGLHGLIEDILVLIKPQAESYGIKLINETKRTNNLNILCDQTRLKQVLLNLISNAIKYNSQDGIVTISTETVNYGTQRINVSDTGPGIPLEKQKKIFEPFVRIGPDDSNAEGAGIGLTITKNLVEIMGGTINFHSTAGIGTCFFVDFQITSEINKNTSLPVEVKTFEQNTLEKRKKEFKVLYIEDNIINTQLVQKVLKKNRPMVKLLCANHARKGIELAIKEQPDLILMDIQLPDMDGIQAFHKLRAYKETINIPVIALSANAMKHQVQEVMSLGFKFYITKPINFHQFLSKIDEFWAAAPNK
ncbi:MAG: signal transduction histidine kinase/ActR/RegA family two-component response regulator [Nitrospinales bacterium]|jgi:signal transduction histidine kinase/ActR/RegA family two-component response regulator